MPRSSDNEIVVYWSPWWNLNAKKSQDIFYDTPNNVYSHLSNNFHPPTETKNYMQCPAVMDKLKKNYVIFCRADVDLSIQLDENKKVTGFGFSDHEKMAIGGTLSHAPTLDNQFLLELDMSFAFFSEESLVVSINSPYFHQAPYLNYGAIVPGEFDIGKWFRPINLEFNLWPGVTRLKIDSGEPLAYFSFETDKKIIFKRYTFNERLFHIASQSARYKDKPRWRPMSYRYERFKEASMKELVMKEIKENLV